MDDFDARTGTLNDFIELHQLSQAENDLFPITSNYTEESLLRRCLSTASVVSLQ